MTSAARTAKNAALALAKERPEMGKVRAARELRGRGIHLSAFGGALHLDAARPRD